MTADRWRSNAHNTRISADVGDRTTSAEIRAFAQTKLDSSAVIRGPSHLTHTKRKSRVQVAIAIIRRGGRILVGRRASGHLAGCWEFPGGKRAVGESWQACVRREVREELGIEIRIVRRLAPIRFEYPGRSVLLQPFEASPASGKPQPLSVNQLRWVTPAQLLRLKHPPANRGLIAQLSATSMSLRPARRHATISAVFGTIRR